MRDDKPTAMFSDVTSEHWGFDAVNTLASEKIISGYGDGTFLPSNNITRAEVATIFFRLLTDESREYYWKESNDFKDIPDNYWACPAISTLTNAGILKGFEEV